MRRLAFTTTVIVATLAGTVLLWQLRSAVVIFLASVAAAAALRPIAEELVNRGWRIRWALGATYLLAGLCLVLLVASILGPLATDVERLTTDLRSAYESLSASPTGASPVLAAARSAVSLPDTLGLGAEKDAESPLVAWLLGVTMGLVDASINAVFVIVLSLYWNIDHVRFERLWLSLLPVEQRKRVREAWHQIETEIGAYLRSEGIQAVTAGILLYIGLRVADQPYPALVAFFAAAAWLIPWLGAPFTVCAVLASWIPAVLMGKSPNLWLDAVPPAVYTLCVLLFLEFVIEPRLFDRRRYNSLLIVLVTVGLADLFGVFGFVLGPPLAAALQIIGEHFAGLRLPATRPAQEAEEPSLRQRLDHLRVTVDEMPSPRPELLSLVGRLEELLEESERATSVEDTEPAAAAPGRN